MSHRASISLISALALAGCGGSSATITASTPQENPTTVDDLEVRFLLSRATRNFIVAVGRTGTNEVDEYRDDDLSVRETDAGQEYTFTLPARRTQRGQVWTFEGRATYGRQVVREVVQFTIANTPPSASLRLEPSQPTTLDDIQAIVDVSDPDDNPIQVTYRWQINDEDFFVTGPTFPARATKRDDVIRVTIVARDDQYETDPIVAQTVIENIAPGPAEVEIVPNPAAENGPVTCVVVVPSIDPDGDEVDYRIAWFRNDAPYSGPTQTRHYTGDTIPPQTTVAGDIWSCEATPTDGTDDGPIASASGEIIPWAGPRIFSNCGARGRTGPTEAQCLTAYAGTPIERDDLSVEAGYQLWTAPTGGRFRIIAAGARGGHGNTSQKGGPGALQEGTFQLEFGDEIRIVVGQQGTGGTFASGGGGGGTFVAKLVDDEWQPLIIAGGGGGAWSNVPTTGCPGNAGQGGGRGSGFSTTGDCAEKTSRLGQGGELSSNARGSGGGGWSTNGADDYPGWEYGKGGEAYTRGARGGGEGEWGCGTPAPGGFGGGGSGNGCNGGGGGGGYSGGDGGYMAGGGGSFNDGEDPVSTRGGNEEDTGWVIIDLE